MKSNPAQAPPRGPKYLLRFDDLCPTMDWERWAPIEAVLLEQGVQPILAVVPDNQDAALMKAPPARDFWDRVRVWQARGWAIGLHGYQHCYVTPEGGILGLNRKSEFAGLPYSEQFRKLAQGLRIFADEGVRADAWVAPSHSFDWVTVRALADLGLRVISDGMAWSPYRDSMGNAWIPQQFATMRTMPFGVWTFCYHPNQLSRVEVVALAESVRRLRHRMITLDAAVAMAERQRSGIDRVVGMLRRAVSVAGR